MGLLDKKIESSSVIVTSVESFKLGLAFLLCGKCNLV